MCICDTSAAIGWLPVNPARIETDLDAFVEQAGTWLGQNAPPRRSPKSEQPRVWGEGDFGCEQSAASRWGQVPVRRSTTGAKSSATRVPTVM